MFFEEYLNKLNFQPAYSEYIVLTAANLIVFFISTGGVTMNNLNQHHMVEFNGENSEELTPNQILDRISPEILNDLLDQDLCGLVCEVCPLRPWKSRYFTHTHCHEVLALRSKSLS